MPQETDQQERERLANLPFLTEEQRRALRDPTYSMHLCRTLVKALRAQQAAQFEPQPEESKAVARAFGQIEIGSSVRYAGVKQIFGGDEVQRG